jgi:carboxylesterase type B
MGECSGRSSRVLRHVLICSSPRCPQNGVDFRRLLKIPEERRGYKVPEDELQCLNLDITMSSSYTDEPFSKEPLPVIVWIYGGWQ